jgi:uncharacterized surface protein with fasciclin (FAS1) repeats
MAAVVAMFLAFSVLIAPGAVADQKAADPQPSANLVETAIAANGGIGAPGGPGDFDVLIAALQFASENSGVDLLEILSGGSFAVFAPTDEAFIELAGGVAEEDVLGTLIPVLAATYGDAVTGLVDVLTYHVTVWDGDGRVRGKTEMVNGDLARIYRWWIKDATGAWASITTRPIYASNGYLAVIDKVILPSAFAPNLVEAAVAANAEGDFDLLLGALQFATDNGVDLLGTLASGNFAVFAPTDDAFIALARSIDPSADESTAFGVIAGALATVYDDGDPATNDALTGLVDVLTYHVASWDGGYRLFGEIEMVNEDDLWVLWRWFRDESGAWANRIDRPVDASNGYITVIDKVLLPGAFA